MAGSILGRADEIWTIRGGFGRLWQRVAAGLRDLRLGVRVEAVERGPDGVRVRVDGRWLECDDLVLALPLERALDFLDARDEERDLFGRIRYLDYHTVVCSIEGLPGRGFYLVQPHATDPAARGHLVAFHRRYDDSSIYCCYAYGDSPAAVQRGLREDVARAGGRLEAIHLHRQWRYFPHARSADVADGFFERLEARQGRDRTYYVGSLLGFELVEATIGHARDLARRHFARPGSPAASPSLAASPAWPTSPAPPPAPAPPFPAADPSPPPAAPAGARSAAAIRTWLVERLAGRIGVSPADLDPSMPIELYPITSLQAVSVIAELADWLDWEVTPSALVEYPTVEALAGQLAIEIG
jgi:acyl carrier protein